ncbi:MAG: coenzyme F420 hydrogenase [Lachnospiraceae bacterium]|jgi:Coenzyme F420-reducing hydrogenase, beta subunit|nr:coenzyme F420 hydrogenase [Lachnospiraceae bacterium]
MIYVYANKEKCCGCGLCAYVCPCSAIKLEPDNYGFLYPEIRQVKCVDCGLCKKMCGFNYDYSQRIIKSFAAVNQNQTQLLQSASGGIFSALASSFLRTGGYVCGAVMNICKGHANIMHIVIDSEDDLPKLQGSKYVQSDTQEIFAEIVSLLKNGEKMLFSGTPCQVAAVKSCVGDKLSENLFTVDIICHGVPNLQFFNDYLHHTETREKIIIDDLKFRDKRYGWSPEGGIEGTYCDGSKVSERINPDNSSYYQFFFEGEIYRDSCYQCPYAQDKRVGDLTIGDYWGVEEYSPELMTDRNGPFSKQEGVSCLLVNTVHGLSLLNEYGQSISKEPVDISKIKIINTQLKHPSEHSLLRDKLLEGYVKNGYIEVEKIFQKKLMKKKFKKRLKSAMLKVIPKACTQRIKKFRQKWKIQ